MYKTERGGKSCSHHHGRNPVVANLLEPFSSTSSSPKDSVGKKEEKKKKIPTHQTETEKQIYPPGMQFIGRRSPSPLQLTSSRNEGEEGAGQRWQEVILRPPALCKMGRLPPDTGAPRLPAPLASPRYLGGAGMAPAPSPQHLSLPQPPDSCAGPGSCPWLLFCSGNGPPQTSRGRGWGSSREPGASPRD